MRSKFTLLITNNGNSGKCKATGMVDSVITRIVALQLEIDELSDVLTTCLPGTELARLQDPTV
ncbi:unnamed protein product [Angiostrongylus costaricensis]|uniref:Transposase n=1 Tax=Angiostrongylus costaricensis TaxID=334426 RepID=A0A0R3Q1P5_ANGCS|nr:unnamed protein product [Angiostrongylus costaricensis]